MSIYSCSPDDFVRIVNVADARTHHRATEHTYIMNFMRHAAMRLRSEVSLFRLGRQKTDLAIAASVSHEYNFGHVAKLLPS
jgi:hypothetical protein